MPKIISFSNQKGGTAKTTSMVNFGSYLAMSGKKTVLIDFDPQADATKHLGIDPNELIDSVYNVISYSKSMISVLQSTSIKNLYLIPSHINLSNAECTLVNEIGRETTLKESLSTLSEYEYILIDCPPSLGLLTINALVAADFVLVPIEAEYFSYEGTKSLIDTIELLKRKLNHESYILGCFLTKYHVNRNIDKKIYEKVLRLFKDNIFNTNIRISVKLAEAAGEHKSIFQYAPSSNGAEDYKNLSEEILDRINKLSYITT